MRTIMILILSMTVLGFAGDAKAEWNWKFWEVKEAEAKIELSREEMVTNITNDQQAWFDKQIEKSIDKKFRVVVGDELVEWYSTDAKAGIDSVLSSLSDLEIEMLHALSADGKVKTLLTDPAVVSRLLLDAVN